MADACLVGCRRWRVELPQEVASLPISLLRRAWKGHLLEGLPDPFETFRDLHADQHPS